MRPVLSVVLRCDETLGHKVRYVFDSLLLAAGIPAQYVAEAPTEGPWLLYAAQPEQGAAAGRALAVRHDPLAWRLFEGDAPAERARREGDLGLVLWSEPDDGWPRTSIRFDLVANAFYFLSSWSERCQREPRSESRRLYSASDCVRLGVPQDIVDRYLDRLIEGLTGLCDRLGIAAWPVPAWPGGQPFALVLSHDVDYLPVGPLDNTVQGAKAVLRHLVRQRDPGDAGRAALGWLKAWVHGRDPYGCVPEIIARERELGVRSSFQVAVGHRHRADVNYRIEDDRVRDYLRAITEAGFEVALHGSYCSTENPQWYIEEAELLTRRLERPLGSRQHFLSFDYDNLFRAQERAGVRYDMSMGYPDCPGPRAGFSHPFFPYNLREDRPYRVLQISLFLMDVTLRSYMGLRPDAARPVIDAFLADLERKRGAASAVWHPIVFGNARDPGYGDLYFDMVRRVGEMGGLATDGRTVDAAWRERARAYTSFSFA